MIAALVSASASIDRFVGFIGTFGGGYSPAMRGAMNRLIEWGLGVLINPFDAFGALALAARQALISA